MNDLAQNIFAIGVSLAFVILSLAALADVIKGKKK